MAGPISMNEGTKNALFNAFATSFANGVIRCYSGVPVAVTATDPGVSHALQLTVDGAEFTPGGAPGGLNMAAASGGQIAKAPGEMWEGLGVTSTTLSWFRHFNNTMSMWIQGTINTSGSVMTVTNTVIVPGTPVVCTSYLLRY